MVRHLIRIPPLLSASIRLKHEDLPETPHCLFCNRLKKKIAPWQFTLLCSLNFPVH